MAPNSIDGLIYGFLTLEWCESLHLVETVMRILIFCWATLFGMTVSRDAGKWQWDAFAQP